MRIDALMRIDVRIRAAVVLLAVLLVATGCDGWSTPPTNVTSTSATLHAQTRCLANSTANPCTFWFQYWADGATSVQRTTPVTANTNTGGHVDVNQTVTGLVPNTLYHAQFCGYGDTNVGQPGLCVGLPGGAISSPGDQPSPGDFNATQRFRTAGAGTIAVADLGRPLSAAEAGDRPISRDAGLSAAYSATESLWIFGDTGQRNGPGFIAGSTAAAGPYTRGQIPTQLQELPTPPGAPTPGRTEPAVFLPNPQGLIAPTSPLFPCGAAVEGVNTGFQASWVAGIARIPGTARVLIVYAEVCANVGNWPTERVTLVEYDPATNRFISSRTPFVASPLQAGVPVPQRLGSPVFGNDGFLYLFGVDRDTDLVLVARVAANPTAWGSAASYRWWGRPGGGAPTWTADQSAVTSIVALDEPWSIHVADYAGAGSHRLAMIVQTQFGTGAFRLYEASTPTGGWTAGPAGRVPDPCVGAWGCYALSGHAELSTADTFVLSWLSPGDHDGFGHMRLGTVAW